MPWCPVTDNVKWRRVISKFVDPACPKALSLSLGDWVYVDQICENWFYGWKCDSFENRGIFPVSCTGIPSDQDTSEMYAELMSFFPAAEQCFITGEKNVFDKASAYLQHIAKYNTQMEQFQSKEEIRKNKSKIIEFLSLSEKQIGFPFQVREPSPLNSVAVKLHEKFRRLDKESKEREIPLRTQFNVKVDIGRCSSCTLTMYLVSQSLRILDPSLPAGGPDQSVPCVNLLSELIKASDDGSARPNALSLVPQFDDFRRISENVTIEGGQINVKRSVVFSELEPFNPADSRILMVIAMSRIGTMGSKKGKTLLTDKRPSNVETDKIRRPVGVACVDITKDLMQTLLPFHSINTHHLVRQSKTSTSGTLATRVVVLTPSGETCQLEVLKKLSTEIPCSVLDFVSGTLPHNQSDGIAGTSSLPPAYPPWTSAFDAPEPLEVEITDVKTVTLQPYHLKMRNYIGCKIARPFEIVEENNNRPETSRDDFFVYLKSASLDKTSVRKDYQNIEVEVSLRDSTGQSLPCIDGSLESQYTSTVYCSKSQPRWYELIRFELPRLSQVGSLVDEVVPDDMDPFISTNRGSIGTNSANSAVPLSAHLRFIVRHRSTAAVGSVNKVGGKTRWFRSPSPSLFREENNSSNKKSSFELETRDKLLGVAFLPLGSSNEQTFIKDDIYTLFIHKMSEKDITDCKYLNEKAVSPEANGSSSSCRESDSSGSKFQTSCSSSISQDQQRYTEISGGGLSAVASNLFISMANGFSHRIAKNQETLSVHTRLYSSQYTTDVHLATILSWRNNLEDVVHALGNLIRGTEKDAECKKFGIRIMENLLQMLSYDGDGAGNKEELHLRVVMLLACIYKNLVNNPPASAFLEKLIASPDFCSPNVYPNYMKILTDLLKKGAGQLPCGPLVIDVNKICSTFYWAFRVIGRSRELEIKQLGASSVQQAEEAEKRFTTLVDSFFEKILMVAVECPDQMLKSHMFKHISGIIDPLSKVYPQFNLAVSLERLVQCTVTCPNLPNHNILSGCLRSSLMEDAECRKVLLPPIIANVKRLFSTTLDMTLEPSRVETNSMMTYFCNILTLLIERFLESIISNDASSVEFRDLFIHQGLLRWVMHEYSRVLVALQGTVSSSPPSSRPHSSELAQGAVGSSSWAARDSGPPTAKARLTYLQPVLGCLATVFSSILQHLGPADWEVLVTPRVKSRLGCNCGICLSLELTDTFDFLHELFSIFRLSHSWPAYPGLHGTNRTFHFHNWSPHLISSAAADASGEQPWVEMLALQSAVELRTMESIFSVGLRPFFMRSTTVGAGEGLDAGHHKSHILVNIMQRCLSSFITEQPHLWLEELPTVTLVATAPRRPTGLFGDLRLSAGRLLENLWDAIGPQHQASFLEFFIPTVMSMSMEPVPELRKICIKTLASMLNVNPLAAEPFLIREVDRVMNLARPEYSAPIIALLAAEIPEGTLSGSGSTSRGVQRGTPPVRPHTFTGGSEIARGTLSAAERLRSRILSDMIRQINYLREYSEVITRRSKLSGMLAINNLRTYYESIRRKDMTMRYLFKLEELHEQCGNDVERGYTLERISSQYSWSPDQVDLSEVSGRYVREASISSSVLKEGLLRDALKYLRLGGDWERAIEVCEELITFYREQAADFTKLSDLLDEQSRLYKTISSGEPRNHYNYYALHFTTNSRGSAALGFMVSSIVYRTPDLLQDVKTTLCEQFPEFHVETNNPQPLTSETPEDNEVPSIRVVANLQPVPELPAQWANQSSAGNLSAHIRAYYDRNQVKEFTRIYHFKPSKSVVGSEVSVAQEVKYIIDEKLPNIVSFMPVSSITKRMLSRIEMAISRVQGMSEALDKVLLEMDHSAQPHTRLTSFVSQLSTSIHSPVSGGITTLLADINLADDSADDCQMNQLSDAVYHLLEVQKKGLLKCQELSTSMSSAMTDSNQATIAGMIAIMLQQYQSLLHEMSMKFGFSVTQLQESVQYVQRPTPYGAGNQRISKTSRPQPDRVYRRADDLLQQQRLHPRRSLQHNTSFFGEEMMEDLLRGPEPQDRKLSLVPRTPPPLPDRPPDLSCSNTLLPPSPSSTSLPSGLNGRRSTITSSKKPVLLPPNWNYIPQLVGEGVAGESDLIPPPLPKKPPKPPLRS